MKKTNKGFSMVELIIVIAIMAILAGAIAPALIKYINKSRLSADVSNAQTIASSITSALSDEDAFSAAKPIPAPAALAGNTSITGDFATQLTEALSGWNTMKIKAKKDMDGTAFGSSDYLITLDPVSSKVEVYIGDATHMAYPNVTPTLEKKS